MKYEVSFFALLVLAGTILTGQPGVSEGRDQGVRPAHAAAKAVSGPISSFGEFLQRLNLEYGLEVPAESWEALEGQAPVSSREAIGLALTEALESARLLRDEAEMLKRDVAADAGASPILARSRTVRGLAQGLLEDPYLAFLDMGRTGRSPRSNTESAAGLDSAARQLHEDAGRLLAEIESLLESGDARVVDWRELSRPSPRQLAHRVVRWGKTIENGLGPATSRVAEAAMLAR